MAKAKVKGEVAASEASPKVDSTASEAPVEIEEAYSNDTSTEPAPSGPLKVEEGAALAVIPVGEEKQGEGNEEDDGKEDDVQYEGKNEEINMEEVKYVGKKEVEKKKEVKDKGKIEGTLSKNAKKGRVKKKAVLAAAAAATAANAKKEELKKEELAHEEKAESSLSKKAILRKEGKKAALSAVAGAADVSAAHDANLVGTSTIKKSPKKEGMGLIFMCSAKTKKDCFKYKVFGLPASKKELVANVYKGMRLFLYDIDLKLMYGIYKAAGPGGYNIEPKAFKSAFPSQVRFTVLNDCLPLPEEKFKAAIKANYYGKNKFNCKLSQEQVKNLCKLFQNANKSSNLKRHRGASRTEVVPSPINHDRKGRRLSGAVNRPVLDRQDHMFSRGRDFYDREAYVSPPPRQTILPPYASSPRHVPFLPPPSYAYERPMDADYYRRDPLLELRSHRIMDIEMRPRDPIEYHDPYTSLYREPLPYREPLYPSGLPVGYHTPPLPPQYRY